MRLHFTSNTYEIWLILQKSAKIFPDFVRGQLPVVSCFLKCELQVVGAEGVGGKG
jgi:hypothetical protein